MAGVVFAVAFSITCLRSALVVDHVYSSNVVQRATQVVSSVAPNRAGRRSQVTSPQRQAATAPAGASPVRILHKRLLAMHLLAGIYMLAGTGQYMLPVSDISCGVARRASITSLLLYDACLVLFLLAKTSVTNGNRTLAGWEVCITWWSRFYAFFYLPATVLLLVTTIPITANEEGTYCLSGSKTESDGDISDTFGYILGSALLVLEFVLLLALFVKPLLVPQGSTQSGGAVYRRVVNRNILCTVCIVSSSIITTVIVVLAYRGSSSQAAEINDAAPAVNMVLTLSLTEISLPLGFSSCYKSVVTARHPTNGQDDTRQIETRTRAKTLGNGSTRPVGTATEEQPTGGAVVPVEDSMP